jgi:hypothetical protein
MFWTFGLIICALFYLLIVSILSLVISAAKWRYRQGVMEKTPEEFETKLTYILKNY